MNVNKSLQAYLQVLRRTFATNNKYVGEMTFSDSGKTNYADALKQRYGWQSSYCGSVIRNGNI